MSKYEGRAPGDWKISDDFWWRIDGESDGRIGPNVVAEVGRTAAGMVNAHLIADAPKLARENEELRAENRRLREVLESLLGAPYPDDVRILIASQGGHGTDAHVACMQMVDNWQEKRERARDALASTEPQVCRWRWEMREQLEGWYSDCSGTCMAPRRIVDSLHGTCYCGKPLEIVEEDIDGA